jgi:hypothetical protein
MIKMMKINKKKIKRMEKIKIMIRRRKMARKMKKLEEIKKKKIRLFIFKNI